MRKIDTEVALSLIVAVFVLSLTGCATIQKLRGIERTDRTEHCPVAVIEVRKPATTNFNQGGAS